MAASEASSPTAALQRSLLRRALAARDPGRIHLRFRADVVDRYRDLPGAQLVRTRSVGRVATQARCTHRSRTSSTGCPRRSGRTGSSTWWRSR
jgi:hypothetical protein